MKFVLSLAFTYLHVRKGLTIRLSTCQRSTLLSIGIASGRLKSPVFLLLLLLHPGAAALPSPPLAELQNFTTKKAAMATANSPINGLTSLNVPSALLTSGVLPWTVSVKTMKDSTLGFSLRVLSPVLLMLPSVVLLSGLRTLWTAFKNGYAITLIMVCSSLTWAFGNYRNAVLSTITL